VRGRARRCCSRGSWCSNPVRRIGHRAHRAEPSAPLVLWSVISRFGDDPREPVVAVRTAGLAEKEALLANSSAAVFTISHFDGYAAVLVELAAVGRDEMREVLVDGWSDSAPPEAHAEYDPR
jgi:hypothetical protein